MANENQNLDFESAGGGLLNDLSDVTTGLPGTPTQADDGKMLFYDYDAGQWVTDDAITHGTSVINCKKSTAGTIAKGLPVYLVGFDADLHTVELADATSGATMPVIGFTAEDLDNTNSKHVTTFGKLTGIDTTSTVSTLNPNGETWAVNDSLYISTTAGGLTKVRPTGGTTQIQRIAKVLKVDATGGQIFVFNTARTAGLPNLGTDKLWIGDANGIPQEVDKSTIGASLYTQDDTIGSGRVATLTDTLTFNGGSGAIFKLYSTLRTDDIFQVFFNGGGEWLAKNGTIDIGAGTTYSNYYTRFTETGIKSYGAGTLVHEINNVTGKVYFMNGYMSGQDFIIGSNATIGSEEISLQGRTLVQGADTLSTSTAFEIYDGDTTPTKLWDFRNDGSLTGWKSKTNLVAQNGTNNDLGEYVFRVSNSGNSSAYGIITNRGYFQFGNSNSISNTDFSTCFQLGHSNSINSTSFYFGLIGQSNTLTGSGNDRYILGKGNNTSGGQEQVILGVDNTVSGNFTSMIGSEGVLSGQFSSAIGRAHNITHQFSVGLGSWVQSGANGASIIGHGVEADKTQKLVNNTANSLALGWNSTTPTYLFASTGATVKVDLDMDNNRITNTIVNPTVQETTSTATFTINATNENTGVLTAQAVALTVANPTGTIVQGQKLVYRIKDNGTARAITWGANFRAIGVTLPTTTTANKLLYVGCIYNTTDSKWDVVAVNEEA